MFGKIVTWGLIIAGCGVVVSVGFDIACYIGHMICGCETCACESVTAAVQQLSVDPLLGLLSDIDYNLSKLDHVRLDYLNQKIDILIQIKSDLTQSGMLKTDVAWQMRLIIDALIGSSPMGELNPY